MVKCADCGFLAAEKRDGTGYIAASKSLRENATTDIRVVKGMPTCWWSAFDIEAEVAERRLSEVTPPSGAAPWSSDVHREEWHLTNVLNEERKCDPYHPWDRVRTPEELATMLDQKRWREQQIEWRKNDEKHAEKMAEIQRDTVQAASDAAKWQKQAAKWQRNAAVISAVAIAVAVVVAVGLFVVERVWPKDDSPTVVVNVAGPAPQSVPSTAPSQPTATQ